MSRGGKRAGAGRPAAIRKDIGLLIGARVEELLSYRGYVANNGSISYEHLRAAQKILHAIPVEKRGENAVKDWIEQELDTHGRCVEGKRHKYDDVLQRVAKEFGVTPRQVKEYHRQYRVLKFGPQVAHEVFEEA